MLAQFGCKKAQITRALDTFVETKQLLCKACLPLYCTELISRLRFSVGSSLSKAFTYVFCWAMQEFGKTKLYLPPQDDLPTLSNQVSSDASLLWRLLQLLGQLRRHIHRNWSQTHGTQPSCENMHKYTFYRPKVACISHSMYGGICLHVCRSGFAAC